MEVNARRGPRVVGKRTSVQAGFSSEKDYPNLVWTNAGEKKLCFTEA